MLEWNGRFQEWNGKQSSILDFAHGIYKKIYTYIVIYKSGFAEMYLAVNHLSINNDYVYCSYSVGFAS